MLFKANKTWPSERIEKNELRSFNQMYNLMLLSTLSIEFIMLKLDI